MRSLPQIRVSVAEYERIRDNWTLERAQEPEWKRADLTLTEWARRRLLEGMTKP